MACDWTSSSKSIDGFCAIYFVDSDNFWQNSNAVFHLIKKMMFCECKILLTLFVIELHSRGGMAAPSFLNMCGGASIITLCFSSILETSKNMSFCKTLFEKNYKIINVQKCEQINFWKVSLWMDYLRNDQFWCRKRVKQMQGRRKPGTVFL